MFDRRDDAYNPIKIFTDVNNICAKLYKEGKMSREHLTAIVNYNTRLTIKALVGRHLNVRKIELR